LSWLYGASVFRTFVAGFAFTLLPVVLYQSRSNEPIRDTLLFVALMYLIAPVVKLFLTPLVFNVCSVYGLRVSFILGQIFLTLCLILLRFEHITLAFVLLGFATSFWWIAYHIFFVEGGNLKSVGKDIGLLEALSLIIGIITPVLSGFVIQTVHANTFWNISITLSLLTIIPTLFLENSEKLSHVTFKDIYNEFKINKHDFLMFSGLSSESYLYSTVWPIALIFVLDDIFSIGLFFTAITLGAILINFFLGKYIDSHPKERIEKLGVLTFFVSWIGKVLLQNPVSFYFFETMHRIAQPLFSMPADATGYANAHNKNTSRYLAFRQSSMHLSAIVVMLIFVIVLYFDLPIWSMFIVAAGVSLLPLAMRGKVTSNK